jgi:Sulfotransferase domain
MAQFDGKIFCIGFYKTGTTSLYEALRLLGYRTINGDKPGSYPGADDGASLIPLMDAGNYCLPTLDQFDAFTDAPYLWIWREIYAQFPDAKYILTVRDEDRWINSCVRFYHGRRVRPMMIWKFGRYADPSRDQASREQWLETYRRHNAEILEFFADKPDQFLLMEPTRNPNWDELCRFLEAPVPDQPWPHANPGRKSGPWRILRRRIKQALGLELRVPSK